MTININKLIKNSNIKMTLEVESFCYTKLPSNNANI